VIKYDLFIFKSIVSVQCTLDITSSIWEADRLQRRTVNGAAQRIDALDHGGLSLIDTDFSALFNRSDGLYTMLQRKREYGIEPIGY
jgi:hypothetical protein